MTLVYFSQLPLQSQNLESNNEMPFPRRNTRSLSLPDDTNIPSQWDFSYYIRLPPLLNGITIQGHTSNFIGLLTIKCDHVSLRQHKIFSKHPFFHPLPLTMRRRGRSSCTAQQTKQNEKRKEEEVATNVASHGTNPRLQIS